MNIMILHLFGISPVRLDHSITIYRERQQRAQQLPKWSTVWPQ